MCGIVGAVAQRDVTPILLEGLRRLEYRGYDSAGLAVLTGRTLKRRRAAGKVTALEEVLLREPLRGSAGIAHTRWATHGAPSEENAHPHVSGSAVAVVHNGIIENHTALKQRLEREGYCFESETDTEVVAHLFDLHYRRQRSLVPALQAVLPELDGAYALVIAHQDHPGELVCARSGSPLVIGRGAGEHFVASDPLALLKVADRFIYLDDGEVAAVGREQVTVWDGRGAVSDRPFLAYHYDHQAADKGHYRHYMLKEIFEQPAAIRKTLLDELTDQGVRPDLLGPHTQALSEAIRQIHIVACGTSYHAGLVAQHWLEELAGVPCHVEPASQYRYRRVATLPGTLLIVISQSGETADTLAVLRHAKAQGRYLSTLAVCNVAGSSIAREAELCLMTRAGPEIGVASTKAFTTQLTALAALTLCLAQHRGGVTSELASAVQALREVPVLVQQVLAQSTRIEELARRLVETDHVLFLGRGVLYPIAMEAALKLKETSYIHAEAYAAGELKHGPLALVDETALAICTVRADGLLSKVKANLHEVQARGGELMLFCDDACELLQEVGCSGFCVPEAADLMAPLLHTIPLQLLAYHVAVQRGTDVDKPRNLAKSVTVE